MKIKAFYGRVSTEEQAERGNIESQVEFAKKYFDLHGITGYKIYLDDGVSGTVALKDRPEAKRLLEDINAGVVESFYVYRLDRLARSVKHVLDTYELLEDKTIPLVSMTEAFDTGTPTGKFFMTLLASIAALERDTILERTQMGKTRASKEGRWTSGMPPYGYRIGQDKKLIIEETEAVVIKNIFRLYAEGMATVPIAKYLNSLNTPTPANSKKTKNPNNGKWNAGHISRILRNKAYTGVYETMQRSNKNKVGVRIEIPSIIDVESFEKANNLLVNNADAARGKRGRDYLLRGLIRCGNCGRLYVGSSGVSKEGRVYYRCSGTQDTGAGSKCDSKMIRAQVIEKIVWEEIQEFISQPTKVVDIIQDRVNKDKKDTKPIIDELDQIERRIKDKLTARSQVLNFLTKKLITENEAEQQLTGLAVEVDSLNKRKLELLNRIEASQVLSNQAVNILSLLQNINIDNLTPELKSKYITAFVSRIDVITNVENGKKEVIIKVKYRFSEPRNSCIELHNSGDLQNHTTFETSWLFGKIPQRLEIQ